MKHYLYIFAAFFALLAFSCGDVADGDYGGGAGGGGDVEFGASCNGISYDPMNKFCVNNEIYQKCGGKEYAPDKEFCFDNDFYPRCGTDMYSPTYYFCFGGKVEQRCDGKTFNPKEEFCDENKLYPLCNGNKYSSKDQFCSFSYDFKVHDKCGTEEPYYNPNDTICFKGTLYVNCEDGGFSETKSCSVKYAICGKDKYNTAQSFCDGEAIYDFCGDGEKYENPSNKFCHTDGHPYDKCRMQTGTTDLGQPIFSYEKYDPDYQKCGLNGIEDKYLPPTCPDLLPTQFCCFGKKYNNSDPYFCFKDELYPTCSRPRNISIGTDIVSYNPLDSGCFTDNITLYPRCSRDEVVGTCVENTLKRCKQLGSAKDHVIDPLPGMQCNDLTGAVTGEISASTKSGYKIAQIGDQVWLAENLKENLIDIQLQQGPKWTDALKEILITIGGPVWTETDLKMYLGTIPDAPTIGTSATACYKNDCSKYGVYGFLNDWALAMAIDSKYNGEFYNLPQETYQRGPCPAGFYLPHDRDWQALVDYAGGAAIAGGRLKSKSAWNGDDSYGFNALPGGYYNAIIAGEYYVEEGSRAMWWSVDDRQGGANAYYWTMISSDTEVRNFMQDKNLYKAYVRCVMYYKK